MKLRQTEDDLLRLADIITEIDRQVSSLKRQVSRAKRYSELSARLKVFGNDTALSRISSPD